MILERIRVGVNPYERVPRRAEHRAMPTLLEQAVEFDEHSRERSSRHQQQAEQEAKDGHEPSAEDESGSATPTHLHLDLRA